MTIKLKFDRLAVSRVHGIGIKNFPGLPLHNTEQAGYVVCFSPFAKIFRQTLPVQTATV